MDKQSWAAECRLDYVDFRMVTAHHIGRCDLSRTFGISIVQASLDLNEFIRRYPGAMFYDPSVKKYIAKMGYRTKRGHTKTVIHALSILGMERHRFGWQ